MKKLGGDCDDAIEAYQRGGRIEPEKCPGTKAYRTHRGEPASSEFLDSCREIIDRIDRVLSISLLARVPRAKPPESSQNGHFLGSA
jgi:hypothetical protein